MPNFWDNLPKNVMNGVFFVRFSLPLQPLNDDIIFFALRGIYFCLSRYQYGSSQQAHYTVIGKNQTNPKSKVK